MKLFKSEEIHKIKKDQNFELNRKNEKVISSLKEALKLQNDIDFDADKARKVKDYQVWCESIQNKKSEMLKELKSYETAREKAKEELFSVLSRMDLIKDEIITSQEELDKLKLQIEWNRGILNKKELSYGV